MTIYRHAHFDHGRKCSLKKNKEKKKKKELMAADEK